MSVILRGPASLSLSPALASLGGEQKLESVGSAGGRVAVAGLLDEIASLLAERDAAVRTSRRGRQRRNLHATATGALIKDAIEVFGAEGITTTQLADALRVTRMRLKTPLSLLES